uniref:ribonuclease H n=1 Tax=Leptobrachium leishanense TaxID=445787 RepID=A0A8C5WE77_9ANUR
MVKTRSKNQARTERPRGPRVWPTAEPARTERVTPLASSPTSWGSNAHPKPTRAKKKARVQQTGSNLPVTTTKFPDQLIEGVYTKALLDSGAQVTLIYRDFYEKHLKHIPLQKLKDLEIWGIGTEKLPYDGYLQVKSEIGSEVIGQSGGCDALAIVCPRPSGANRSSMIVGTNTDLVRRLLTPMVLEEGSTKGVHPMLRPVYQRMVEEQKAPAEVGHLWRLEGTEKVLQSGEVASFRASVKLNGSQPGPYVVLETDFNHGSEAGVEVIPEIISTRALKRTRGRVSVSVCNVSDSPVVLKARMPIVQVASATPLSPTGLGGGVDKEIPDVRFYPKDAPISPEWKKRFQSQVLKWRDLFSKDEFDLGLAKSTEHRIRLQEDKPFRERSRRVPLGDLDLREQLNELQRTKVIQESRSPYASPIVMVRKKNGSVRLCIDYRTLNQRTIPDQYATPRIADALQCLSGAKWFSVLDLRSGYHQIPMHPEDKEKTAFICPLGFFEFNRMPQGLMGAPATFQRLMEKTVGDMNLIEVLVYLDDIIVFGKTLEEHEQRLEKVLKRLHEEGLKLSLEKCQFCLPSVTYLGHVVSAEGVSTDPRKLEAVASWPRPRNVTELRSFLGFCSYYRRFVGGFAKIAQQLNKLLQKEDAEEGHKATDRNSSAPGPRKARESIQGEWTSQCEGAFVKLKESLSWLTQILTSRTNCMWMPVEKV